MVNNPSRTNVRHNYACHNRNSQYINRKQRKIYAYRNTFSKIKKKRKALSRVQLMKPNMKQEQKKLASVLAAGIKDVKQINQNIVNYITSLSYQKKSGFHK